MEEALSKVQDSMTERAALFFCSRVASGEVRVARAAVMADWRAFFTAVSSDFPRKAVISS